MEKIKKIFKIHYVYITIVIILIIIGYIYICPDNKDEFVKFFVYLDNQTIAILIGAIIGLFIWFLQHQTELNDKYFAEYIGYIFQFYALKQKEIDLRFGKNRRWWDFASNGNKENIELNKDKLISDKNYQSLDSSLEELDRLRIENDGKIKSTLYQLEKLNNEKIENIEKIRNEFGDDFKKFTKHNVADEYNPNKTTKQGEYKAHVDCINNNLEKSRKKIEDEVKL